MTVRICLFSTLKDYFRMSEHDLEINAPATSEEIFLELFKRFGKSSDRGREFLRSTRFAVNGEYVSADTLVQDGNELALIPPVSGG